MQVGVPAPGTPSLAGNLGTGSDGDSNNAGAAEDRSNRRLGLPPPGIGVGEVRRRNCRLPDVAWGDSCDAIDVSMMFSCKERIESEPRPRFGVLREYR